MLTCAVINRRRRFDDRDHLPIIDGLRPMRLRHIINLASCHALVSAIGLCVAPLHVRSQSPNLATLTSACMPSFPYKDGWLGGDAGYSIALAPGKSLWLFGDSFVGKSGSTRSGS